MVWIWIAAASASEEADIAAHLHRTEQALRAATPTELPEPIRENRVALLDALHGYHEAGRFPHNHDAETGRARPSPLEGGFPVAGDAAPVFIDEHDTACAVAELLRVSGAGELARRIADQGNLRFVAEIDEPELAIWAADHGFTADELARIQPTYRYAPTHVRPGRTRAVMDLTASAVSSATYLDLAAHLVGRVQSCLNESSPTSLAAVELLVECDDGAECIRRVFGPPEADEVLTCLGGGPESGPREAGFAMVTVRMTDGALPEGAWAFQDPPPQGSRGDLDTSAFASIVGPRRAPTLPERLEPNLQLWVDPASIERDVRHNPMKSRGIPGDLRFLERCVRVPGMAPTSGTLEMTWGDYGNTARLELEGAPEAVRTCIDRVEKLWGASALTLEMKATVAVTRMGEGPEGWWRPADRSQRLALPEVE